MNPFFHASVNLAVILMESVPKAVQVARWVRSVLLACDLTPDADCWPQHTR